MKKKVKTDFLLIVKNRQRLADRRNQKQEGKMSKYGSLRSQDGHSKIFLAKTLDLHDRTMEHPLMQAIYDKRITDVAYKYYLTCMLELFLVLETDNVRRVIPNTLEDEKLHRVSTVEQDIAGLVAEIGNVREVSAAVRQYFTELYTPKQLKDRDQMICHHFLHYNAMLSGIIS